MRAIRRWAVVVLAAMVCVEAVNSARTWSAASSPKRFPYDYVSRGFWSMGGYVRPPADHSLDIAGPIKAASRLLRGSDDLYAEYSTDSINYAYPPSAAIPMLPFG